jgi:soluble lytic murein transglycosylase-like protein
VSARAPGARRRSLVRLAFAFALATALAWGAWREYRVPVRAAVRDYLSFRRVEGFEDVLRFAAVESGVDPNLLAALMIAESSGRVGARSSAGALGLFQLTMTSAKWRATELGLPEPSEQQLLSDALLSARLGADNLAWLIDTYDGDVERALCAYNAGARRMKEITDAVGGWQRWRDERQRTGTSAILAYAHKVLHYRDELRERGFFPEFYPPEPDEALVPPADAADAEPAAPAAR